jgi:hypothetical protein
MPRKHGYHFAHTIQQFRKRIPFSDAYATDAIFMGRPLFSALESLNTKIPEMLSAPSEKQIPNKWRKTNKSQTYHNFYQLMMRQFNRIILTFQIELTPRL